MVPINLADIQTLDEWLDSEVALIYRMQPLAQDWARISKISEELGEAVDAFIGFTGQNPRKGVYGTKGDLTMELIDVAITALLALQHFTKDTSITCSLINQRMIYRMSFVP